MSAKQWIGIAIIAIVVLRLWDIPVDSAAQYVSGDWSGVWMQFLAYGMMHMLLRVVRVFRGRRAVSRSGHGSVR
jgi:hypothetical protein